MLGAMPPAPPTAGFPTSPSVPAVPVTTWPAVPPVSSVGVVADPLVQPARSRARTKAGVPRCEDRDDRTAPNNPGSNQVMEYRGITPAGTFKGASVPATKIVGGACNPDGSHGRLGDQRSSAGGDIAPSLEGTGTEPRRTSLQRADQILPIARENQYLPTFAGMMTMGGRHERRTRCRFFV